MNRSRLLFIGSIALALGALVSFVVYSRLKSSASADARPGVDVVVAADDMQVGARIQDHDVKVVRFAEGTLPANTFHRMSQVVGRGVVQAINRGEFVLPSKLAGENGGSGLPSLIPPGMLAVSVRVNEVTSVAGFVVPGTHVDVLLTGNPPGVGEQQQQTTTVLENVAVVATGPTLEKNSNGDPQTSPDVTLLVSPDDAQKLTLASTQGRIQLALRNPLDTSQRNLNSTSTSVLYRGASVPVAPKPQTVKHARVQPEKPPAPYSVEVIQGNTRKDQTLDDSH